MHKKNKQKEPGEVPQPINTPEIIPPKIPEYPELPPDEEPQIAPEENPDQNPLPEIPQMPKEN